jgi:alkanesulfonate monooxygenase SsuD/methylene tetrahydromethanopterin reductase-like flavin-dependent oxidoreductase (luciferase family)
MRLALELPSVGPLGTEPSWDALCEVAVAAEACGVETLWVAGGGSDPVTLAGALAAVTTEVAVGVVCGVGVAERAPSVLARDVAALDVLSAGRAAVLLEGSEPVVGEAAEVCRLLFAGGPASFDGEWFQLDGAVNRPPPVGTVSVLLQAARPPDHAADGWVTTAGPGDIGSWRQAAGKTPLYWRGSLGDEPATLADALLGQGVDGLIARVPASVAEVQRFVAACS